MSLGSDCAYVHILVMIIYLMQPPKYKKSSRKNMKHFSLHLEPSPLVKFSTITVMCMRWQSWKVMPCPHKPTTRNSEKIIAKNRACPHKPATRNSEKIIDKNRARTAGYWVTALLRVTELLHRYYRVTENYWKNTLINLGYRGITDICMYYWITGDIQ